MLESEAEKKWCPMVRTVIQAPGKNFAPRNRVVVIKKGSDGKDEAIFQRVEGDNCIGSACMMWRWERLKADYPETPGTSDTSGYCGLGGKE